MALPIEERFSSTIRLTLSGFLSAHPLVHRLAQQPHAAHHSLLRFIAFAMRVAELYGVARTGFFVNFRVDVVALAGATTMCTR